jgi:hypothetical protein
MDEIMARVKRIYSAIDSTEENDISDLKTKIIQDGNRIELYQDWTGELSQAQISNLAISLIDNIAKIQDHLKKWAKHNNKDVSLIDTIYNNSQPLLIIQDLANNDKHGYPPRDGGLSKMSPRVVEFHRILKMTTLPKKGSMVGFTLAKDGSPIVFGSGSAIVIIDADIIDNNGKKIGDFNAISSEALIKLEELLYKLGITQ